MKTLAIIPARGGSKGIHKKNLRLIDNKPLIFHTIKSAKKSGRFDKIIVSTDDVQIGHISQKYGAEVPFYRPKKISSDTTRTIDIVKHTIDFFEKNTSFYPEIITILQPTSPIRDINLISKSIKLLKKSNCTSVISISKVNHHPYTLFKKQGAYIKPCQKNFENYSLRQSQPELFNPTGSVYTFWTKTLKKYNSIYGPKIIPLVIKNPEQNIDIDNIFDFFICSMIIKNWKKFKKKNY